MSLRILSQSGNQEGRADSGFGNHRHRRHKALNRLSSQRALRIHSRRRSRNDKRQGLRGRSGNTAESDQGPKPDAGTKAGARRSNRLDTDRNGVEVGWLANVARLCLEWRTGTWSSGFVRVEQIGVDLGMHAVKPIDRGLSVRLEQCLSVEAHAKRRPRLAKLQLQALDGCAFKRTGVCAQTHSC